MRLLDVGFFICLRWLWMSVMAPPPHPSRLSFRMLDLPRIKSETTQPVPPAKTGLTGWLAAHSRAWGRCLLLHCPALADCCSTHSHCSVANTHRLTLPPILTHSLSLPLSFLQYHTHIYTHIHAQSQSPTLIQLPLSHGSAAQTGTLFLSGWKEQSIARWTHTNLNTHTGTYLYRFTQTNTYPHTFSYIPGLYLWPENEDFRERRWDKEHHLRRTFKGGHCSFIKGYQKHGWRWQLELNFDKIIDVGRPAVSPKWGHPEDLLWVTFPSLLFSGIPPSCHPSTGTSPDNQHAYNLHNVHLGSLTHHVQMDAIRSSSLSWACPQHNQCCSLCRATSPTAQRSLPLPGMLHPTAGHCCHCHRGLSAWGTAWTPASAGKWHQLFMDIGKAHSQLQSPGGWRSTTATLLRQQVLPVHRQNWQGGWYSPEKLLRQ